MKRSTLLALGGTLASAVLCRLTVSPTYLWPVVPFCYVPFIVVLENVGMYDAFRLGLLHGTLVNIAAFIWVLPALVGVADLSRPLALVAFALLVLAQGGRDALIAVCVAWGRRGRATAPAVFPFALVAAELVYPYVFPWQTAIFTQSVPAWMQWAEFGGPLALSLWVGSVNALFAAAWLERRAGPSRWFPSVAAACVVLATVTVSGRLLMRSRAARAATAPVAHVGIVQGNAAVAAPGAPDPVVLYRRETLKLLAEHPGVDLVIWPETMLSQPTAASELRATLRDYVLDGDNDGAGRIRTPLLLGMVVQADGAHRDRSAASLPNGALTNSAILTDAFGQVLGRYDKRELVPFGERDALPAVPLVGDLLRAVTTFSPGIPLPALRLNGHPLALSICYEDILRDSFRDSVRDTRPELLVNLTSDSWFASSPAPELHFALAALRAVEHRRYLVRATDTGISAVVDATGTTIWRLPRNQTATGVATVRYLSADTLYEELGDAPWLVMTALAGIALAVRARFGPLR